MPSIGDAGVESRRIVKSSETRALKDLATLKARGRDGDSTPDARRRSGPAPDRHESLNLLMVGEGSSTDEVQRLKVDGRGAGCERRDWEGTMCLTCGCMLPHEDHGKANYLTIEDLEAAATIDDLALDEAVKNLVATVEVAKKEQGHQHL
jgi:hypothetical protein